METFTQTMAFRMIVQTTGAGDVFDDHRFGSSRPKEKGQWLIRWEWV
jgi:hypothetical protein